MAKETINKGGVASLKRVVLLNLLATCEGTKELQREGTTCITVTMIITALDRDFTYFLD